MSDPMAKLFHTGPPAGEKQPGPEGDPKQRRTTERMPFGEEVRFVARTEVVAKCVNIGAGGLGVVSPVDLPIGQSVEIEIFDDAAKAFGTVRWSNPVDGGFRLGIQFREEDWAIMEMIQSLKAQEG